MSKTTHPHPRERNRGRTRAGRSGALLAAAIAAVAAVTSIASAGPGHPGNRLEATFHEQLVPNSFRCSNGPQSLCQGFLTGSGQVTGYGAATEEVSANQDRGVTPCGPGSAADQSLRHIVLAQGTLVLRLSGIRCLAANGPIITSTYRVDGQSSTGMFAGARGRGSDIAEVATGTATISGKLKLAQQQ